MIEYFVRKQKSTLKPKIKIITLKTQLKLGSQWIYQDQGTEGKINEEESKPAENKQEQEKSKKANARKELGTNMIYWQVLKFGVSEGKEKEVEQMLAGIISENIIKMSKDNMNI